MAKFNWFVKNTNGAERTGVLMKLEENSHSRYEFEIWFEYTRLAMNEIREGTMLAVPNYTTTKDETHYSILEVTAIKPIHYAIGEDPQGYPGFVMEAAKNAAQDWTGQDDEPTEDTTTIRCAAIPTNLELVETKNGDRSFQTEENIPMVGTLAYILDTEPTKQVVNRDIDLEAEKDQLFVGGTLIRNTEVDTYVRIEDFIQVHFAIFGFTGSGKSNLLSTYIAKLFSAQESVKIVFFDLMSEYTSLLIDLLDSKIENSYIVALDEKSLPEPVIKFLHKKEKPPKLNGAAKFLNRVTLLPKGIIQEKSNMQFALSRLLDNEKLKIFSEVSSYTIHFLFYDHANNPKTPARFRKRNAEHIKSRRNQLVQNILFQALPSNSKWEKTRLTKENGESILATIKNELEKPENKDFAEGTFDGVIELITQAIPKLENISPAAITYDDIIRDLNDGTSGHSLYIIQSHDPDTLRDFSFTLGEKVYESRRTSGEIRPLVSFVFDEADEFIPRDGKGSYEKSRAIVTTLARRGRKFGLGVGIATQRVRYLDTSIMAQPHTYLVSKLPRQSDRQAVAEAFGVSEEMFRQTFKFKPGNWLLMSHDATGLKAIPVPVQTEDANKRIQTYLQSLQQTEQQIEDEIPF